MLAATAMPPDLMGSTEQHKEVWFLHCCYCFDSSFLLLLLFLAFACFCPCLERRAENYEGRVNRAVVVARRIPK